MRLDEELNPAAATRTQTAAEQIARDLGTIRKLLRAPLEAEFAKGNLTGPQRAVMQVVVAAEGISLKELSVQVGLAQSTVSGIVDRLVQRGMVERRADPSDGRGIRVHPAAVVTEFLRDRLPALTNDPLRRALEKTSKGEADQIARALALLKELLES